MSSPFPGMDPYLEHPALWPDIAVISHCPSPQPAALPLAEVGVLEVEVPMADEVSENFLEV